MRGGVDRTGALVAALVGVILALTAAPVLPPFLPIGDHPIYDAGASRALLLVEPVMHAPWSGAWPRPLAMAASALVLWTLWHTSRRLGATAAAALVGALSFAARPDLGGPLALGSWPLIGAATLWLALLSAPSGGAWGWRRALGAGAAVACWPPWLVAMPFLAASGAWTRRLAVLGAAAAGALLGGLWWAQRAGALAGTAVSLLDVWTALRSEGWRGTAPFAWPPLSTAVLPVTLMLAGAAVTCREARLRAGWAIAVVVAALGAWATPGWAAETTRALYWLAWPLVGVGVTWFADRASAARRGWALGAMALVLVGGGVVAHVRDIDEEESRAFARALLTALGPLTITPTTILAEDSRVDTALVAWLGTGRVQRVRADRESVEHARARGRVVLAAPTGRALAELGGVVFEPAATIETPLRYEIASFLRTLPCEAVGRAWTVVPAWTGRIGVHLPAGAGHLELVSLAPTHAGADASTILRRPVGVASAVTASAWPSSLPPIDGAASWPGVRLVIDALASMPADYQVVLAGTDHHVAARADGLAGTAAVCAAPVHTP